MELHIYGRNLTITGKTRDHVESKLDQIDRHLPGISDATVELTREETRSSDDRIVAQVSLHIGGRLLRAQRRAADTEGAMNSVAQALDQQIKRYKGHAYRSERNRHGARGTSQATDEFNADISGAQDGSTDVPGVIDREFAVGPEVVRVKEFEMEPMSVDEAAVRMQFLGHSFYMFLDSESDKYGVLYLREDGNLGLIQPTQR